MSKAAKLREMQKEVNYWKNRAHRAEDKIWHMVKQQTMTIGDLLPKRGRE